MNISDGASLPTPLLFWKLNVDGAYDEKDLVAKVEAVWEVASGRHYTPDMLHPTPRLVAREAQ